MNFTPEVIAALETLKNAAENELEFNRLKVLEENLKNPPKVEIIDDRHQKFLGMTFSADCKEHYRLNVNLHRLVWMYFYGEIPNDYAVHHIDENPHNNDISNLLALSHADHNRLHMKKLGTWTFPKKNRISVCKFCGKEFLTDHSNQKFCSQSCRNKQERVKNREDRTCVICGKTFNAYKNDKTVTCSPSCSGKLRRSKRKQPT